MKEGRIKYYLFILFLLAEIIFCLGYGSLLSKEKVKDIESVEPIESIESVDLNISAEAPSAYASSEENEEKLIVDIEDPIILAEKEYEKEKFLIEEIEKNDTSIIFSNDEEIILTLAKLGYCEARGLTTEEIAAIMWCVLNRYDSGKFGESIHDIVFATNQFYYVDSVPTISDNGTDLLCLAKDVLQRWEQEKAGYSDVGRILPNDYYFFYGDGKHNYFSKVEGGAVYDWSLTSPY